MSGVETIGVATEVLADGSYGVGLTAGEDVAWALSDVEARAYALECIAIATASEHESALFRLLQRDVKIDLYGIGLVIGDMRTARQRGAAPATSPVRFEGGVNRRGDPFVKVLLRDGEVGTRQIGQLTTAALREHAAYVLVCITASALDRELHRVLMHRVELDAATAQAVIGSMAQHWPDQPAEGAA